MGSWRQGSALPILLVLLALLAIWYLAAIPMNWQRQIDFYGRSDVKTWTTLQLLYDVLNQEKPLLPTPHQIAAEVWKTTVEQAVTSKRSLVYHGWITLSATLLGFLFGSLLGIGL